MKALPCPFCGQQPRFNFVPDELVKPELPVGFWVLTCHRKTNLCHAQMTVTGTTKSAALSDWNKRAPLPVGESDFRDKARRTFQPVIIAKDGVARFKPNAIVDFLLRKGGFDMNDLVRMDFTDEDRAQFAQLIGYSVCGYGELNYVRLADARVADALADQLCDPKGESSRLQFKITPKGRAWLAQKKKKGGL